MPPSGPMRVMVTLGDFGGWNDGWPVALRYCSAARTVAMESPRPCSAMPRNLAVTASCAHWIAISQAVPKPSSVFRRWCTCAGVRPTERAASAMLQPSAMAIRTASRRCFVTWMRGFEAVLSASGRAARSAWNLADSSSMTKLSPIELMGRICAVPSDCAAAKTSIAFSGFRRCAIRQV